MTTRRPVPASQQLGARWMLTTYVTCCLPTGTRASWNQRRSCVSFATAPQPPSMPLANPPPLHDTIAAATSKTTREDFAAAFARATADVADDLLQGSSCATHFQRSAHLSAWTEYLVGLRDVPPSNTAEGPQQSRGASMRASSFTAGSPLTDDFAAAQDMFLHHIFDDVKEAALYSTTRRPEAFLRPEQAATDGAPAGGFQWQLMPLAAALKDMEVVLQDMLLWEQGGRVKGESAGFPTNSVVAFWRAMLEQAFLGQYCELAALNDGDVAATGAPQHWLQNIYPYDYSRQPAGLRRRLERGIRALLCSSAYTLHMHWEQHMARHPPSDGAAKILGLEFVMLWWWANPDQMPIEVSLAAARLPPPTQQSLRQRESPAEAAALGHHSDGRHPAAPPRRAVDIPMAPPSVEQHLQRYIVHHLGWGSAGAHTHPQDVQQQRRRHAVLRDGGLLCPAAVFPPAYQDALRAHLARVRHRKNLTTCPLFLRLVEVALAVATSDAAALSGGNVPSSSTHPAQCKPLSAAARRGREIAIQLCQEWLWPVVCGRTSPLTMSSLGQPPHSCSAAVAHAPPHAESMETFEDWAVLIAAVVAVSQVRGNLLALRRAGGVSMRGRPEVAHCATFSGAGGSNTEEPAAATLDRSTSLAHVRDRLYMPLMRVLLADPEDVSSSDGEHPVDAYGATVRDDMPGWVALVFARVSACFEEAGMLQRDVARQPATPARLWCLLFHAMCDAFPSVFHSGNTVTVMWTLLALEGVCAGPSLYYSTYRATNAGKTQTMSAWLNTLAAWNGSRVHATELALLEKLPSCADESEAVAACALCPRMERCQRTAFVLSTAVVETSANDGGLKHSVEASTAHSRQGRRHSKVTSLPSFASALSPALPLQRSSAAALAQARAHLTSCAELSEEVVTVSIEVFRRYATLPVPVPGVETLPSIEAAASVSHVGEERHRHNGGRLPTEAALLRPRGHPSLMVLLRLLQVVALFGESGNPPSVGDPGLVQCVVDDVISACHPMVAVYLRKLRVYAAAVSGRSGALALLHNETLQRALDSLPPSLGRQRLVKALLWSGLPASALEEGKATEAAVYGSGSLAWYVLERNQQRFLTFNRHNTSAAASIDTTDDRHHRRQPFSTDEGSEIGSGAGDGTNSFAEVVSCLDEVVRHLWQLAIAIPDTARVALCLHPYVSNGVVKRSDLDTAVNSPETAVKWSDEGASVATSCDSDGVTDNEPDPARASSGEDTLPALPTAAASKDIPDALEYESSALLESTADECLDAEVDGANATADWGTSTLHVVDDFDDDVAAVVPAAEDAHAPLTAASLWDSRAAVRSSVTREATHREDGIIPMDSDDEPVVKHEGSTEGADSCNTPTDYDDYRALAHALLLATPAAQHIFYSLLEVLSWIVTPQSSSTDRTTSLARVCPLGHAQLPGDIGHHWRTRLAANYGKCVSVWQAHCHLTSASTAATPGAAVLCRPQAMERVALLLLQSCPDVYVLGLLLLAMAGGTADTQHVSRTAAEAFARRLRRTGSLLPWSVESSLAQLLYHAGVTAASVRRWRMARGLTGGSASRCGTVGAASAALLHVVDHRRLLQRVQNERCTVNGGGGTSDADYEVKRDLLLSMGNLLLCSLEQRGAAGSQCRVLYRHNAYVNEFLLHRMPTAAAAGLSPSSSSWPNMPITALRVLLPSAQLTTPSPSSMPPQQVVSLRIAWQRRMGRSERAALRSCFRGTYACVTQVPHHGGYCDDSTSVEQKKRCGDDKEYAAAFA
ncbi:conserved hypothetical protein [Leishmania mexicana MHOM/GT/2001/U1103]|uniref:Uncharacterized protein n=1 Tax=Leishmania mexicana (strain MHOM/GT/2001/U1103) TaxID=929439 RepID=E9B3R2_LEIMU|nr:conserved hypothetical protein [Leishmania mexicana MHOM/GT/2001/U1103]CBZ29879.1 conserved hypothetical protein [Leishmania mexicana MHOM/GT/2001/U1103]